MFVLGTIQTSFARNILTGEKCVACFSWFWLVSMVFQVGFMVFHGFWLVSMVFQGGFMVFHGFCFVYMVFTNIFKIDASIATMLSYICLFSVFTFSFCRKAQGAGVACSLLVFR